MNFPCHLVLEFTEIKLLVRGTGTVRKQELGIFCWICRNEGVPSIKTKELTVWKWMTKRDINIHS